MHPTRVQPSNRSARLSHVPDPRTVTLLTDRSLRSTAKVIYMLLDQLGGGQPTAISQPDLAARMSLSREIVADHLTSLRRAGYIEVSSYVREDGRRINTYRTRVLYQEQPVVYTG